MDPTYGLAYAFSLDLVDASHPDRYLPDPPLVTGDVTISQDWGPWTTVTSLPTVPQPGQSTLRVSLTAAEMTAGVVDLAFHDAEGVWQDVRITLTPALLVADPWATPLPGSYAAGSAGYLLGTMTPQLLAALGTTTLQAATAYAGFPFHLVQAADPTQPALGVPVVAERRLDDAMAYQLLHGTVVEVGEGDYYLPLLVSDIPSGTAFATFRFAGTGALTVEFSVKVSG